MKGFSRARGGQRPNRYRHASTHTQQDDRAQEAIYQLHRGLAERPEGRALQAEDPRRLEARLLGRRKEAVDEEEEEEEEERSALFLASRSAEAPGPSPGLI